MLPGPLPLFPAGVVLLTTLMSYLGIGALGGTAALRHSSPPPAELWRAGDGGPQGTPFFVPSPLIALAVPRHLSELGRGGRDGGGGTGAQTPPPAAEPSAGLADVEAPPGLDLASLAEERDSGDGLPSAAFPLPAKGEAWPWPAFGFISTEFGPAHPGLDIAAPYGAPVQATASGVVVEAQKRDWGLGWFLVLSHGGEVTSTYAHLGGFLTKTGDPVAQGQLIGWVGSTGYSTGPHLHFELRRRGLPLDPADYLAREDPVRGLTAAARRVKETR